MSGQGCLLVMILCKNEAIHIARAIKNVSGWADHVVVLDSFSEDKTAEIAKAHNAEVIYRKFDNYKNQREYAINLYKNKTRWMLFLDADEYLSVALKKEITSVLKDDSKDGYFLPRRFMFMGKWIKWGGYYPIWLLRLFRPQKAKVERGINEHIFISGSTGYLKNYFIDDNLKGIGKWIEKHNIYSDEEARDLIEKRALPATEAATFDLRTQQGRKMWIRQKIWNKFPAGIARALFYFFYRYVIRLGFLDGKEGFIYHGLQGFWFLLVIDLKYQEMKNKKCVE